MKKTKRKKRQIEREGGKTIETERERERWTDGGREREKGGKKREG